MTMPPAHPNFPTIPWVLRDGRTFTPAPFGIMGIVNLAPDSFYDGGRFGGSAAMETTLAVEHTMLLVRAGAHILDLGAESTRPGATPLDAGEEWRRLQPVLQRLTTLLASLTLARDTATPGTSGPEPADAAPAQMPPLISIDTYHAATARKALDLGAHIINDVSACSLDPALREVLAVYKPGYVLTHSSACHAPDANGLLRLHGRPVYGDILDALRAFFDSKLRDLTAAGLPESHVVLDPGIGFGKSLEDTLRILQNIEILHEFKRPVLMALSMKSLFRDLLGLANPADRGLATQVATALLAARGVSIHRVHDVAACAQALRLTQALSPTASPAARG